MGIKLEFWRRARIGKSGSDSSSGGCLPWLARCQESRPTPIFLKTIEVGAEPHGLTVWPQPGRYSLAHTGNMR